MHTEIEPMGENALLLRLGDRMDDAVNANVHALVAAIADAGLDHIVNVVPAYASVLVCHAYLDADARGHLHRDLQSMAQNTRAAQAPTAPARHDIPVCYGAEFGPDLAALAKARDMTEAQVIEAHTAPTYRVAMTGFAPGFPYLLGLEARLATPRRDTPRTRVAAGSVGIAGRQTGIYPGELPGGWQLIGRTPLVLFDANAADRPCLLTPGDEVRFRAIDAERFEAAREGACSG